jgi:hypothetical protein
LSLHLEEPDNLRVYITHCSAKKNNVYKRTGAKVRPDKLYTGQRIQLFMTAAKAHHADWAILSDLYGIWFPNILHEWYEKPPDSVTEDEFKKLVADFDRNLREYEEIWFYYNPSRYHSLYDKLLTESRLRDRIKRFTHIEEIV